MRRADVIREISTPRGADPAGQAETIVFNLINPGAGHHSAHLRFLAEHQQIRQHTKMFAAPIPPRNSHSALHFIKNQPNLVLIANLPQGPEKFTAKMIVPALTLNWFDNDRRDSRGFLRKYIANLLFGQFLRLDHRLSALHGW